MLLSEAISEFLSWKGRQRKRETAQNYSFALRQFAVYMRNPRLELITVKDVTEWFDLMETLGWSTNAFIPMTIALRQMFDYFREQGYAVPSSKLIPVPRKVYNLSRVLDEERFRKLLDTCKDDVYGARDKAIMWVFWRTGMRNGELCALDISQINKDLTGAIIATEKTRGRHPFRPVFWPEETTQYIKEWLKVRKDFTRYFQNHDENALFISLGGPRSGKRIKTSGVGHMLLERSKEAGIPICNAHSFRHHLGHDLAKKQKNNSTISSMLGHANMNSSRVYTDLTNTELEEVYRETYG